MGDGTHDDQALVSATSDADGIEIVRILEATPEQVFDAWTRPEGFAAWFGEHGSSIPLDRASMDPRPGGAWQAVMLVGDDTELVFAGTFREVDPPHHLVMTVTDRIPTADDPVDILTVDLEDLGDGRTQMVFSQRGGHMPADEYERAMRGWLIFFERLGEHLKTRHLKSRHDSDS
jgi:uncharacterized protein YndB with AHSA1/START domain